MLELMIEKAVFKLDFIDLNILENVINEEYCIPFPKLVSRLKKINVWNRDIIRRRISKLKELKLIDYREHTSPIIVKMFDKREKELIATKDMLKARLIRY